MSKTLDDRWLYAHVPEAEESMLSALTDAEHTFSRRFERRMRALLRYERRGHFGRAAALAGRAAAAVLAAVLVLNLIFVGTVEAYREEVWQLTLRVTERFTEFRVTGESTAPASEFVPIEPPYIPEGYVETERLKNDIRQSIAYSSTEGLGFVYFQRMLTSGTGVSDTEDAITQKIEICNCEVRLVIEDGVTQLYWLYGGYSFSLVGNASFEDLEEVAESILRFLKK